MAAFEVIALDTATPQLRAPGASDTYTFPRAVEMPLGTANGVLYLNGSKVMTSGSALTFDGTNLGVGINPVSYASKLATNGNLSLGSGGKLQLWDATDSTGTAIYNANNSSIWFGTQGGSEYMRLTSTGLGIGTSSPGAKLQVLATGKATIFGSATAQNSYSAWQYNGADVGYIGNAAGVVGAAGATDFGITAFTGGKLWLGANNGTGTTYAVLDSSGNLGLGVTPSAWGSGWPALQVFRAVMHSNTGDGRASFGNNYYVDGTDARYIASAHATQLMQASGEFRFFTAPSGTAGNAISFTQAMTLNASGNLGVGTTSPATRLDVTGAENALQARFGGVAGRGLEISTRVEFSTTDSGSVLNAKGAGTGTLILQTESVDRLEIKNTGQTRFIPLAADPTGAENGDVYYNSTTNKLRLYAAGAWVDLN